MSLERLKRTQPHIAERLNEELEKNVVPQSIMFLGPSFSSRMSGAIELALNLLGEEEHYQALDVNDLIILSNRNHSLRLKALRNAFAAARNQKTWNMLLHETRLLLLSYHSALSQSGDKDTFKLAGDLSDLLYSYKSDMSQSEIDKFISDYDKALNALLNSSKKKSGFTIDQIRDVQAFLQLESKRGKAVILENIEDVTVGAMNSLLKLLEEPMDKAYLILISKDQSRILDTILSRVRKYEFNAIDSALTQGFILDSFFKKSSLSLEEFFYTQAGFDSDKLKSYVDSFFEKSFVRREHQYYEDLNELNSFLDEFDTYSLFMRALYEKVQEKALYSHDTRAMKVLKSLTTMNIDSSVYNQNKKIMIDRVERSLRNE